MAHLEGPVPDSAYQTGKRIEKRILSFFGHLPFATLDADRVGAWKASLAGSGLKPASVNSYLSLLGTILNTAVDSDYLPHSPLMRRSRAGRVAAAKNLPVNRREVWITRGQLDLLAQAISPCYRALVMMAALTGLRFGELAALRWDDVHLDKPLDDGAVAGPGRLRVVRGLSDPSRCGHNRRIKGPKTQDPSRPADHRPRPRDLRHPPPTPRGLRRRTQRAGLHHPRRIPDPELPWV